MPFLFEFELIWNRSGISSGVNLPARNVPPDSVKELTSERDSKIPSSLKAVLLLIPQFYANNYQALSGISLPSPVHNMLFLDREALQLANRGLLQMERTHVWSQSKGILGWKTYCSWIRGIDLESWLEFFGTLPCFLHPNWISYSLLWGETWILNYQLLNK